jgi:hypothetical protein
MTSPKRGCLRPAAACACTPSLLVPAPTKAPSVHSQAPLVGAVGQEFVHSMLSSTDPTNAVREVQRRGAFAVRARTRCAPAPAPGSKPPSLAPAGQKPRRAGGISSVGRAGRGGASA